jgi:hypothetical protein
MGRRRGRRGGDQGGQDEGEGVEKGVLSALVLCKSQSETSNGSSEPRENREASRKMRWNNSPSNNQLPSL